MALHRKAAAPRSDGAGAHSHAEENEGADYSDGALKEEFVKTGRCRFRRRLVD